MMFSLVDSLHRVLKSSLSVSGSELPTALLEHVRANDSTVLEASDKVQLVLINMREKNCMEMYNSFYKELCFVFNGSSLHG